VVRKTKEEALETRERILDAAEHVFQERGVGHTSLAEIATAAGVTRGAIYWHFANKVDLFDAMLQRIFAPMEAKLAELQQVAADNPLDMLRDFTMYFIGRVAQDATYARILEIAWHKCEYVGEMATIRDNHLECGNRYLDLLTDGFALAKARGYLMATVEPRVAAVGLMAVVDGLIVNWTLESKLFPLADFGPRIIDQYFKGLTVSAT
jgi:TetR/AcrR family acrAB operon transcriptional repressor